ncbi:uncharacterized mitochondrial protein AtMg00810-like [Coffea arabica]|uniref:Uncharacterized mitochondrial protein AtMg00810-like n=1 Tax=Coffea arabica TaxID=13443 RepID=A0ABM4WPS7_COFAR
MDLLSAIRFYLLLKVVVKNIKDAFLNDDLIDEVYMWPPLGFPHYSHKTAISAILLLLYVDDLVGIQQLKHSPSQQFEMEDHGSLNYFLGLEVSLDTNGYHFSQSKYTFDLLDLASLLDSETTSTQLKANTHLTLDGTLLDKFMQYHQLVGSLVYLIVNRPDIAYTIHIDPLMPSSSDWGDFDEYYDEVESNRPRKSEMIDY